MVLIGDSNGAAEASAAAPCYELEPCRFGRTVETPYLTGSLDGSAEGRKLGVVSSASRIFTGR